MLLDFVRDIRLLAHREYFDMKEGFNDCKKLCFLTGQFVPTHYTTRLVMDEQEIYDKCLMTILVHTLESW